MLHFTSILHTNVSLVGICRMSHRADECGTRPFLKEFRRRIGAQTRSAAPKMPRATSAFPLIGAPQVPGNKPSASKRVRALRDGPLTLGCHSWWACHECRLPGIHVPTNTADRSVSLPSSLRDCAAIWHIYISTNSSHVNTSSTIHFNTCICSLEIRVRTTSRYRHIVLHNT